MSGPVGPCRALSGRGENALLRNEPRSATIKAVPCSCGMDLGLLGMLF